jgi:hypothetical protein
MEKVCSWLSGTLCALISSLFGHCQIGGILKCSFSEPKTWSKYLSQVYMEFVATLQGGVPGSLAVQTGVYGWALWCNNKTPFDNSPMHLLWTVGFSLSHAPHDWALFIVVPCLHNACVLVVVNKKSLFLCCWLHFELYFAGRLWYFRSILGHLSSGS